MINVGRLKKLIDQLPDESLVMVPGPSDTYKSAHITVKTALFGRKAVLPDYGEELTSEVEFGKRQVVLLVE